MPSQNCMESESSLSSSNPLELEPPKHLSAYMKLEAVIQPRRIDVKLKTKQDVNDKCNDQSNLCSMF
jgi:hypothetical protein